MNFHKQVVWTTRDGQQFFKLKDIEDSHLVNIVYMLRRNLQAAQEDSDDFYEDWGPIHDAESAPPNFIMFDMDNRIKRTKSRLGIMSKEARRRGLEVCKVA